MVKETSPDNDMVIETSSYNGMAVATLVADIHTVKNSFFAKMLLLLTKKNSQQKQHFGEKRVFDGVYVGNKCCHGHTITGR